MKWDQVVKAQITEIMADPKLATIYGANVRMMGTGTQLVPSLEYMVIGDAETELWNPVTIQWDQWCFTMDDLIASERQLRRIFHQDLPVVMAGLRCWTQYTDGAPLTAPDRNDFHGRAIRFTVTPLREQYDPVPPPS